MLRRRNLGTATLAGIGAFFGKPHINYGQLLLYWLAAFAIYFLTPIHKAVGWVAIDVTALNGQIESHMRGVHGETDFACLYAVSCESGAPRLELQTALTSEKMDSIKQTIWRRWSENYCAGQVTNLGLEHSHEGAFVPRDCFSVGNGFGGAVGFASGCAFHEHSRDTPCTRDKAYWTREHGIVARR